MSLKILKQGGMPSTPTDKDFELTFADLAHAQLADKAPQLLDYLLGFQIVDKNEEGTHGIGILGFKVGEQLLFIPTFFMNGEIKQNLIYLKDQDLFVPLQENWINYLLSRKPFVFGHKEPRKERELGVMEPDLRALSNTQAGGTAGTVFGTRVASWEPWAQQAVGMFKGFKKNAKLLTLPEFLKKTAEYGTSLILAREMREDLDFGNKVLKFYKLSELLHKPTKKVKTIKKASVKRLFDRSPAVSDLLQKNNGDVNIYFSLKEAESKLLSDEDLQKLAKGEILIKDSRIKTNQAYRLDEDFKAQNPAESGVYNLLLSDGDIREVCIFINPRAIGKGYSRVALVVDKKTGSYGYWWPEELWALPQLITKEDKVKFWESLPGVDIIKPNNSYVLVDPDSGQSTVAFKVEKKVKTSNGFIELFVTPLLKDVGTKPLGNAGKVTDEAITQFGRGPLLPFVGDVEKNTARNQLEQEINYQITPPEEKTFTAYNHIVITNDDRDLRVVGNTLFAPKKVRVIKLTEGSSLDTWAMADPSGLIDVVSNMLKAGADVFQFTKNSGQFYINDRGPFNKQQVITALLKKANLETNFVLKLVEDSADNTSSTILVKNNSVYTPPFPDEPVGFNEYVGVPETYSQDQFVRAFSDTDPNSQAYTGKLEREQLAQAAQTGQQEVFDAASIANLVKTINLPEVITKYLSDIILGMDRVNRILFLYYWFNEKFRDRYGQENMAELEDQLVNVSKYLGDLILFLKQRKVTDEPGLDMLDVGLMDKEM